MSSVPYKKRKLDGISTEKMNVSTSITRETQREEKLKSIKNAGTFGDIKNQILQRVLLDVHAARIQMEDAMTRITDVFGIGTAATASQQHSLATESAEVLLRAREEALEACSKLSEVHEYGMLTFSMKPEIALHRSLVGGKEFALAALPDIPIKKILKYISFQDKLNLREVSKGLSTRIIQVDPSCRNWKITVLKGSQQPLSRGLDRVAAKGFHHLRNFQLHCNVCISPYLAHQQLKLLECWKNKITTLELCTDGLQKFSSIFFPNLTGLIIKAGPAPRIVNREKMLTFFAHHASIVTSLRVEGIQFGLDFNIEAKGPKNLTLINAYNYARCGLDFDFVATGLHNLTLIDADKYNIFPFFKLGANTKSLDIDGNSVTFFDSEDLHLPSLKHLYLRNEFGLKILHSNAAHLETLLYGDGYYEKMDADVPDFLPNLRTFLLFFKVNRYEDSVEEVEEHLFMLMSRILYACQFSLQRLVIRYHVDFLLPEVRMARLTDLLCLTMSNWCVGMIKENAATLQHIVIGVDDWDMEGDEPPNNDDGSDMDDDDDDDDERIEEIRCDLPVLKRMVLLSEDEDKESIVKKPSYLNLVARYPHAKIVVEERSFDSYLKTYCKPLKINIDPYYFSIRK
eukprot:TRINITY_DN11231_c0_g1_i2.p1 TRINITY_DN11231_c0_g1~~TRINITY_DN11231_c0_g1_i2.p1  ORF type:complete len:627 (+),score=142.97 TRINITY_DN11231_c0_g1_i2:80-1960(+)